MWWKWLLFSGMGVMIYSSFVTPAPQKMIGEASRVFYYHIPQAWICVLAFLMSMIYSIRYLSGLTIKFQLKPIPHFKFKVENPKDINFDDKAAEAARLGFIFCFLATITGSIFAKVTWGSFWNWDPRETSVFILLLIYAAYFSLRGAVEIEERKATLSAVYSIFAFVTVPFLIFVVPRMTPSLHPEDSIVNANMKFTMGPAVRMIFFSSLGLFTVLYFWMFSLAKRLKRMERIESDKED